MREDDDIQWETINTRKRKKKTLFWDFQFTVNVWNRVGLNPYLSGVLLVLAFFLDVVLFVISLSWILLRGSLFYLIGKFILPIFTGLVKSIALNIRKGIGSAFYTIAKWSIIILFIYFCITHSEVILKTTKYIILNFISLMAQSAKNP